MVFECLLYTVHTNETFTYPQKLAVYQERIKYIKMRNVRYTIVSAKIEEDIILNVYK